MRFITLFLLAISLAACSPKSNKTELWVYTSTFKEVLAIYDPVLKKELPDIEIKWFQSGSENVASKIMAELSGGGTKADMMITSDLFFYQELKKEKQLRPIKPEL